MRALSKSCLFAWAGAVAAMLDLCWTLPVQCDCARNSVSAGSSQVSRYAQRQHFRFGLLRSASYGCAHAREYHHAREHGRPPYEPLRPRENAHNPLRDAARSGA